MISCVNVNRVKKVPGVILVSWGTLRCPGIFSGLAIQTETKPFSVYIEIEYFMYNTQLFDAF